MGSVVISSVNRKFGLQHLFVVNDCLGKALCSDNIGRSVVSLLEKGKTY